MWVADMDFASPPCVLDALSRRVEHGVFGYAIPTLELNQAVVSWAASHYAWQIEPDWIVWLPGLVSGLHVTCLAFTAGGQEVVTFTPVYPPFLAAPRATGRDLVTVPLVLQDNHWTVDAAALDRALTSATKLLLLCNPHNPVGRAFTGAELAAIAGVCERHDLMVCSDEIHCDLILDDRKHIPFATLDPQIARRTVTLMSPAKTFNLPGLNCGFAVIPDPSVRQRFQRAADGIVPHPNIFGYTGCHAAFSGGESWRIALLDYLRGNRDFLEEFLAKRLPMLSMAHVEATYLAWIDTSQFRTCQKPDVFTAAGVRLSDGAAFAGSGFARLNFGCPRKTLQDALQQIEAAVERLL